MYLDNVLRSEIHISNAIMKEKITRRSVLASSASVASAGALFSGSAIAAKGNQKQSNGKGLKTKKLTEAITISNGKAKVKGWARNPGKAEISLKTQSGESASYSARDLAENINQGVENGYWTVKKTDGELNFDLTEKWHDLVNEYKRGDSPIQLQNCDGRNTIEDGVYYFDDTSFDEIQSGIRGAGTVTAIAGIIVGAITTATLGPAVFAIAGLLVAFGAGELGQLNEGCGIKVDPDASNEVQSQDCNC